MSNVIEIVIKQSGSGHAIADVNQDLAGLGKQAGISSKSVVGLGNALGGLGKIAAGAAAAGFVALGAAVSGVVFSGLKLNNSMEQVRARLLAITKDGALTAKILENIRSEADQTPFAFEEMAQAAANLLPAAKQSGVELMQLIKLSEILAASNPMEGLEGAAFSLREALSGDFVSIVERFNLPRTYINQLKDEGVPALDIVSQALQQMGLDSSIVANLAGTMEGRWSTFKDTLQGLAAIVTQPLFDVLSAGLGQLNTVLSENSAFLKQVASDLAVGVANGIAMVIAKGQELFAAFQAGGFAGLAGAMGLSPETIGIITSAISFIMAHLEEFKMAIIGIGAVLAGAAITAAIVSIGTAIAALATPIGAVVVAVGLIGAAWAGNWFGIQETTMQVWAVLQPMFDSLITWLTVNIPPAITTLTNLWTAMLPAMTSIGNYISLFIPFWQSLANLIQAVVNKAIAAMVGLWQNALLPAMTKVGQIILSMVIPGFGSIGSIVTEISPVLTEMSSNILPAISSGFDAISGAIQATIDLFNSLASAVMNFELPAVLTPGSPPPMAVALMDIADAAGVSRRAIDTLTQGIRTASPEFARMMSRVLGLQSTLATALVPQGQRHDITNLFRSLMPQFAGQFETGQFGTGSLVQGIQQGLNFLGSNGSTTLSMVLDAIDRAGVSLDGMVQSLGEAFTETQKMARLANAAQAVGIAGQLAQFGTAAAQRLADQVDILTEIIESGEAGAFQGQIVDATTAQLLLNEALADQAGIQQQIVDLQRQQADLQWLQQQISLIQMVKDAGLDVQDILGGITFGLNASIPDIVTAMNNVVQAMINQIDSDLAIQSPSKVMIDRMRQVGGGMVRGLMAAKPMVEQAVGSLFEPLTGGRNGSSTSRVTNNYFNQTVNTRADSSTVIGDFNVMRGLIGA